jgi:hypothetical protein
VLFIVPLVLDLLDLLPFVILGHLQVVEWVVAAIMEVTERMVLMMNWAKEVRIGMREGNAGQLAMRYISLRTYIVGFGSGLSVENPDRRPENNVVRDILRKAAGYVLHLNG